MIVGPSQLLAYGCESRVGILSVQQEEENEEIQWKVFELKSFQSSSPVIQIAWSFEVQMEPLFEFTIAFACLDHVIRICSSNQIFELNGHTDLINNISFHVSLDTIASVSDDCTVKIWYNNNTENTVYTKRLSSPGKCMYSIKGFLHSFIHKMQVG